MNHVDFWDTRYKLGPGAGAGSAGRLYDFKLEVVQSIVDEFAVRSVVDYGCGDGRQLAALRVDEYTGYDISSEAIKKADAHASENRLYFAIGDLPDLPSSVADMVVSLDVIMHLPPGSYELYMENMFRMARRGVLIYAPNGDFPEWEPRPHMFPRKFTEWIDKHTDATLLRHIPNRYPATAPGADVSFSEFFLYEV